MALVLTEYVRPGDIVQIIPKPDRKDSFWDAQLIIVTELKKFGVQGYVRAENGLAFIRLAHKDFVRVGRVKYIRSENNDNDDN